MTRDTRHLGQLPFWRGRCCGILLVLIASILLWLSPSELFASVVTHSTDRHPAQPPWRGSGMSSSFQLPARPAASFGWHAASGPAERVKSETQLKAPVVGTLPLLQPQPHPMVSRIGAVSVEARLAVLQSRGLPLIC